MFKICRDHLKYLFSSETREGGNAIAKVLGDEQDSFPGVFAEYGNQANRKLRVFMSFGFLENAPTHVMPNNIFPFILTAPERKDTGAQSPRKRNKYETKHIGQPSMWNCSEYSNLNRTPPGNKNDCA